MTFLRDDNVNPTSAVRVNALDCHKEYLDATLETMIKQEINYGIKVGKQVWVYCDCSNETG